MLACTLKLGDRPVQRRARIPKPGQQGFYCWWRAGGRHEHAHAAARLEQPFGGEELLGLADGSQARHVVLGLQLVDRRQLVTHVELAGADPPPQIVCHISPLRHANMIVVRIWIALLTC